LKKLLCISADNATGTTKISYAKQQCSEFNSALNRENLLFQRKTFHIFLHFLSLSVYLFIHSLFKLFGIFIVVFTAED